MAGPDLDRLMRRALDGGAAVRSPSLVYWDVSGSCESPVEVIFQGRLADPEKVVSRFAGIEPPVPWDRHPSDKPPFHPKVARLNEVGVSETKTPSTGPSVFRRLEMHVPCRKCAPCLTHRRKRWSAAA